MGFIKPFTLLEMLWTFVSAGMMGRIVLYLLLIGQRGEPEGARPASDEIMRVRLSLTSAHALRRMARGELA